MRQVILIVETMPGYFEIKSALGKEQTANLLNQFAVQAYKQSAIQQYEKALEKQGNIISPHTGKPVPSNESFRKKDKCVES